MGYYTYYTLNAKNYGEADPNRKPATAMEIAKSMQAMGDDAFYPFEGTIDDLILEEAQDTTIDMEPDDTAKWYDYDKEMKKLSEMYPNTLFKLHGDGEEGGDSWDAYYLGGKKAEYRATIPPFDPKDLE